MAVGSIQNLGGFRGEHDLVQDLYEEDTRVSCWVTKVQTLLQLRYLLISYILAQFIPSLLFSELILKYCKLLCKLRHNYLIIYHETGNVFTF